MKFIKKEGNKVKVYSLGIFEVARRTRLELATPGVTGRYSNQLNYRRASVTVVVATRLELVTSTL